MCELRELRELLLREARADFADGLVLLRVLVIAREQIRAVSAGALAAPVPSTDGNEVEAVSEPVEIVLLELEPVERALRGLIPAPFRAVPDVIA